MSHPPRPTSTTTGTTSTSRLSTPHPSTQKARQLSHLQSQLAQLTANMADLESLVRMTAQQAGDVRGLGGWVGGLFMASSKVLGEETVKEGGAAGMNAANPTGASAAPETGMTTVVSATTAREAEA